jgi:hypothetical protein
MTYLHFTVTTSLTHAWRLYRIQSQYLPYHQYNNVLHSGEVVLHSDALGAWKNQTSVCVTDENTPHEKNKADLFNGWRYSLFHHSSHKRNNLHFTYKTIGWDGIEKWNLLRQNIINSIHIKINKYTNKVGNKEIQNRNAEDVISVGRRKEITIKMVGNT